eukprot:CAMPEP_0118724480 /NCGR_PEP_ID=MMETSP0800-20121206/32599_1 /TAXON_ID=210618 ORGANISM="Striatella unipunctata, Strain CCMP2910" /NCGR_SAMPLE_ID=MMETSP0800 /ASSEMBLY_ACC=CAM_ASM_000638 /LENGTH=233 /DNA_ID=CAMNT_0006633055 /DNA_START=42 /DNA_END=740 /DNA_ORIENTATION=+
MPNVRPQQEQHITKWKDSLVLLMRMSIKLTTSTGEASTTRGLYQDLVLQNIEVYSFQSRNTANKVQSHESLKRLSIFAQAIASKVRTFAKNTAEQALPCFLSGPLAIQLLEALTKKIAHDAQGESDTTQMVNQLSAEFKERLLGYFRRSSELLRHFFGMRQAVQKTDTAKLARIVQAMEGVYREMEEMRKEFPQSETGEIMRKMCLPIMDQLDWAFQVHRDESGGGGGFVTVE